MPGPEMIGPSLVWDLKTSFRKYVASLPDGIETWSGPGEATARFFRFCLEDATGFDRATGHGRIVFTGTVRFRGYRGALNVTVGDPIIDVTPEGITVSVNTAPPGAEADRVVLATASDPAPTSTGDRWSWSDVAPELTAEGGMLLGSVYGAQTSLAPMWFEI